MSLINEALKKAQRQRTDAPATTAPAAPVASTDTPAPRIAKRRPPMPARTLMLLIGGGGALVVVAAVFVFVFFLADFSEEPAPSPKAPNSVLTANGSQLSAPSSVPSLTAHSSQPIAPSPQLQLPAVQLPAITVPAAVEPAPSTPLVSSPAPLAPASSPQSPSPQAASPTPASSVAVAKEGAPSTGDSRVHEFLEKLRVAGIRASETDPRVIMNDRIYRVNDIVDKVTRLRLTRVEASALTFVDATGFEYRKNL